MPDEEMDVVAAQAMIPRDRVGADLLVRVPDVRFAVRVVDRGREVVPAHESSPLGDAAVLGVVPPRASPRRPAAPPRRPRRRGPLRAALAGAPAAADARRPATARRRRGEASATRIVTSRDRTGRGTDCARDVGSGGMLGVQRAPRAGDRVAPVADARAADVGGRALRLPRRRVASACASGVAGGEHLLRAARASGERRAISPSSPAQRHALAEDVVRDDLLLAARRRAPAFPSFGIRFRLCT